MLKHNGSSIKELVNINGHETIRPCGLLYYISTNTCSRTDSADFDIETN